MADYAGACHWAAPCADPLGSNPAYELFARYGMKAYLVLDLSVNDLGGFRKYIAEIPAFIAKHSGRYIVQGVQPTTIEGDWKPERMVIIEFPERKNAEAFLSDPQIQDLFKVRHATTMSKLVLADGCT